MPPIFEAESPAFSGAGVTARMTQIVRQKADHPILSMTQKIRDAMDSGPVPVFETRHSSDGSLIHLDAPAFEAAMLDAMHRPEYQADPDYGRVTAGREKWVPGDQDHAAGGIIFMSSLPPTFPAPAHQHQPRATLNAAHMIDHSLRRQRYRMARDKN